MDMNDYKMLKNFYKGKTVFITGHTGFKGSWICEVLLELGANVVGYSLAPDPEISLYGLLKIDDKIKSYYQDIRDRDSLIKVFQDSRPDIAIHMAAQPIVRESYVNPAYTYETNVMGTVNFFEAVRLSDTVKSVVNVTTDKVYLNKEWQWGYRENDELNGYDPYSNSKSCSELVTSSYINSFLINKGIAVSTCRAGNVIGGGDFAKDRIIPDCIRAVASGDAIIVRNPHSTRPYQHVLEPIVAYLIVAMRQFESADVAGNYNVGPDDTDCWTTGNIVNTFCQKWNKATERLPLYNASWLNRSDGGPHEASFLKLDCSKIKSIIGWKPTWNVTDAIDKIIEWNIGYLTGKDVEKMCQLQINAFFMSGANERL